MRSRVFDKLLNKIIEIMVVTGSSDAITQKPRYGNKQLETAMTAPINRNELKKRVRNG